MSKILNYYNYIVIFIMNYKILRENDTQDLIKMKIHQISSYLTKNSIFLHIHIQILYFYFYYDNTPVQHNPTYIYSSIYENSFL